MAKPKGLYNDFIGTLDGVTYYYVKGKRVARKHGGGFTRESIKNKATMQKVRDSNNDFGHTSKVNKALRMALQPLYQNHNMGYLHSRLMKPIRQIIDLDSEHESGAKNFYGGIQDPYAYHLLRGFAYTSGMDLPKVFPFLGSYDPEKEAIIYKDVTAHLIKAPNAATHAVVQAALVVCNPVMESIEAVLSEPCILDLEDENSQTLTLDFTITEEVNGLLIPYISINMVQAQGPYLQPLLGKESLSMGVV